MTLETAQFDADVEKFIKNLHQDYSTGIRKIAFDLFQGIVDRTPRLTGRAQGSWTVNAHKPDETVLPPREEGEYPPPVFNLDVNELRNHPPIYVSNNLDYILALEEGWSKEKAPEGMVAITVQEIQAEIQDILERSR